MSLVLLSPRSWAAGGTRSPEVCANAVPSWLCTLTSPVSRAGAAPWMLSPAAHPPVIPAAAEHSSSSI